MSPRQRHRKLELPGFFDAAPELSITFEGKSYGARRGETLAQTLLAHGVYITGRSVKYHRPRGMFCGRGACGHCTARIDGRPNQRTCMSAARQGSRVESQNVVGSARFDLLSTIDWLFPGGIDHHRLMTESTTLNRVTMAMARELSGLGELPDDETSAAVPSPEDRSVRVAVVGSGPAGSAAATVMRRAGLDTLVIDPFVESPGGMAGASVIGFYDDRHLLAASSDRLWRIHADAIVLAMGGYEQLPLCAGNDMPGILARRAVEEALDVGVLPGKRIALAVDPTADASTRRRARVLATRLATADVMIEVALGFGEVPEARRSLDAGIDAVEGRSRVRRVRVDGGDAFDCDAVIWCGRSAPAYELARQMGLAAAFDAGVGGFVPEHDADGRSPRSGLYVAGELAGVEADAAGDHGARVGATVIADLGRPAVEGAG